LKKLLDLHEQVYNQTVTICQKQEKMEKIIGKLSSQVKDMSEKLGNVGEKNKLEWWEVCINYYNLYLIFKKFNFYKH
jgi:hypothetical protein